MSAQDDDRTAVAAPEFDPVLEALAALAEEDIGWIVDPTDPHGFVFGLARKHRSMKPAPGWFDWEDRHMVAAFAHRKELPEKRQCHGKHLVFIPRSDRAALLAMPEPPSPPRQDA